MSDQRPTQHDADDIGHNDSGNPGFDAVLRGFLSRRRVLQGGIGTAATLIVGGTLAGCGGDDPATPEPPDAGTTPPPPAPAVLQLNFDAVARSLADALAVPAGYTASVLYALGDPLSPLVTGYANDGGDAGASFAHRAGDHHDGMAYFGLAADGAPDPASSTRGLIAINHENITQVFLHMNGPTAAPRPAEEALKEINAHGVAVYEVARAADGSHSVVRNSAFNRRITPNTAMDIRGPAAGNRQLRTLESPTGTTSRGTINNCASGSTPWGTYLTCEENWATYFARAAGDDDVRGAGSRAVRSLARYGVAQDTDGSYAWNTAAAADPADWTFRRWDASQSGASADGSDDFRNEPNTFGYVVEIDPYRPESRPRKRTALGRFAHEATAHAKPVAGRPLVFYMGDDSRGEYLYKFVSAAVWSGADAGGGLAAGDKYLDEGMLYVARFNADGSGNWLALTPDNPAIASGSAYLFEDQADICINTRLAADAAGATKMDRPEWTAVNPRNGDVYLTLTNNSNASRPVTGVDAANPRSYGSGGNANGHIIRLQEADGDGAATGFAWDIYLFGAPADADAANVNISGLTAANDFSSPDGIWFDTQGVCWIQTDDGAYTSVTNCMMLAAVPGSVGDGGPREVTSSVGDATGTVATHVGAPATEANLRRFLVGPRGCEITGIAMTPDLKALFVNIQHPGESTTVDEMLAANPQSCWPGQPGARPRSATVVITRDDGGTVGGTLA